MSAPYPPHQPQRKLTRSTSNRLLGGVCAGVAEYLNMDVNLVRVLTVVISLFTGVPVVLYLVALFLIPDDRTVQNPPPVDGPQPSAPESSAYGAPGYGSPEPSAYAPYPSAAPGPAPQAPARGTASDADMWGPDGPPWDPRSGSAAARSEAPATAAPEDATPVEPEPVIETATPEAPQGEESVWESAPANPESATTQATGSTPPPDGSGAAGSDEDQSTPKTS